MSKEKKKTIIDYYLENDKKYVNLYGENSIVVLESGHFMEIYDYVENSRHLNICRDILGIMITRRDKSDNKSPFMAGIPTHSIRRYYKILLKNNYTVIIISQITPPPDVKREVTKILSPGCNLSEDLYNNADHGQAILVSIVIEIDNDNEFFINLSTFDSNIGETKLQYLYNESNHSNNANLLNLVRENLDKIYFNEILINFIYPSNLMVDQDELNNRVINEFGLKKKLYHIRFFNKKEITDYYKLTYQNQFLEKMYPQYKTIYCNIKENLNLEKEDPLLIINLIFLFNFISMHDKCLIANLTKPIIDGSNNNYLKSFNETYSKLNIFESNFNYSNSLFNYINFTSTPPGKRLLINGLKNPILDKQILEKQYDMIDEVLTDTQNIKFIEDNLKIIDLERIYRRFSIGKLNPYEIPKLGYSNIQIQSLIKFISDSNFNQIKNLLPDTQIIDKFNEYCLEIERIFDFEKCAKSNIQNISDSLFNRAINSEIDLLVTQKNDLLDTLEKIASNLSKYIDKSENSNFISVKYNDKEGYWFDVTKIRGSKMRESITKSPDKQIKIKDIVFELKSLEYNMQNKTNVKISSHQIKKISKTIINLNEEIVEQTKTEYMLIIDNLYQKYFNDCILFINYFISNIDLIKSSAKCAYLYKYCRPQLLNNKISSIKLTGLRHPIIERLLIENGNKYVPNDVYLGPDEANLLYGVNSVGKSSLLKSIAISVILAQSGLFVPASSCQLSLYNKIFSRTGNDDNLFLNHSSFVKEMTESKEIIQKADHNSLIIADELCASTEIESAVKIVTSIIKILSNRKSSFIFATHMFRLMETDIVKNLTNLKCKHLKVEFKDELIFDRKLTDGLPENKFYGLLVANKIIQDQEFSDIIADENNFLNDSNEILSTKKSHYNQKLYVDTCQICSYKPINNTDLPLETHHINMQCEAIHNYHGIYHKNELHNLVILCKNCHQTVHNDGIVINGYTYLDSGTKLDYKINTKIEHIDNEKSKKTKKKKYDQKTTSLIKNYYDQNTNKPKLEIIDYFKKNHNLILNYTILNKIISNEY